MFKKLQLKLIFIYTLVLIAILLITNILIYFTLSSYNTNQLADDVEKILVDINSSEWVTEYYDEDAVPQDIDDEEETHSPSKTETPDSKKDSDDEDNSGDQEPSDEFEGTQTPVPTSTSVPNLTEEPEKSEDSVSSDETEDSEEPDETDEEDETDEIEHEEESDDADKLDKLDDINQSAKTMVVLLSDNYMNYVALDAPVNPLNSNGPSASEQNTIRFSDDTDLYIPNILNSFSYYFIYSNSGDLLRWKSSSSELLNQMYSISLGLEVNQPPELIDLSDQGDGVFIVLKRPIIVDGTQLGYYTIGENVSAAYNTLDNLKLIMILVTIVGSLLSLGIGYLFAGRVIKPIKEAYKTKEKFIGDASHELRIPLSIILLSMEMLKRNTKESDNQNVELIEDAEAEALNMKDLVDKLLFIARNDSKSIKLKFEKINLSKIIDENIEKFKMLSSEKHLTYKKNIADNLIIQGDAKMIDSVVSILIDNAEKYNKKNGEIIIEADTVFKG